ncbi:MAG: helix-turn-helix domain-containing protein [Acidimicrobiia bacterium]
MASNSFGPELRDWRQRRRLSQLHLAAEAGVSQRHLSFLETGRSRPSREMVLHLATVLDVPLRERNTLLTSAGFAPVYSETALDEPAMGQVRHVLEFLLEAHEPFPAIVVDRRWDVVMSNEAAVRLTVALVDPEGFPVGAGVNMMRLALHPDGVRRFTVNWPEVATTVMDRLRREAAERPHDDVLRAMVTEAESYPDVADLPRKISATGDDLLVPIHYKTEAFEARVFGTIATLGAAYDVTVEELRMETFFPADAESEAVLRSLAG